MTAFLKGMHPELAAALIAVIGVIISAIISTIISRRSSYITAVTKQRSIWIDKLREKIAELLAACGAIRLALPDVNSVEAHGRRGKADRLMALNYDAAQSRKSNRCKYDWSIAAIAFESRARRSGL